MGELLLCIITMLIVIYPMAKDHLALTKENNDLTFDNNRQSRIIGKYQKDRAAMVAYRKENECPPNDSTSSHGIPTSANTSPQP